MIKISGFEKKTRSVFDKIHTRQWNNLESTTRLRKLLNTKYLHLDKNYFKNKVCLDAGCGTSFHGTINLLNLKAKEVHAVDLDNSIFKFSKKLNKFKKKNQSIFVKTQSVLNLDYKKNYFDFVLCQGVIHHSENPIKALRECYRVLKPGGKLYIQICGKGGLIHEMIFDFLRKYYLNDKNFKKLINNLNEKNFDKIINLIIKNLYGDKKTNKLSKKFLNTLKALVDEDLILSLKDRIEAPVYHQYDLNEIKSILKRVGFRKFKRVFTYPKYKNLRNIISYYFNKPENKISRLILGSGLINLIITK